MSILPVANNVRNSAQPKSNVYQDNSNLVVASARVLNKEAYRFGFQSTSLGSSANTLTIPKNLMVSHVLVELQLNLAVANLPAGWYLPASWGYSMLRRLTLVYGGSEQLEIDGRDNFIRMLNECEDDRKKSALIQLGGKEVYNNAGGTSITGLDAGQDATVGGTVTAVCAIYLPHSSANAMKQIPFDSGVLNMPITIRADLNSAEDVWQQTRAGADAAPAPLTVEQRNLSKAEWIVGQQTMIDSGASKRDLVGPNGQFQLNYFWYYPSHFLAAFNLPRVNNSDVGKTISDPINITLNGFRNGSLQSMVFYVERVDNFRYRNNPAAEGMRNPLNYLEMTNIRLEFGGQIVYTASSTIVAQALDAMINTTDSTYDYTVIGRSALNTPSRNPGRSNYYRVQLSQFSEVFRDYLQNGAQLSSDSMQLSFSIIDDRGGIDEATAPPNIRYNLHAQYLYQSSLSVSKGVGAFTFVNPTPSPMAQQLSVAP